MKKTDVLTIGGSASGIVTALTGKSNYADKTFLIVRKEKQVVVPCGIPYIFGSLENSNQNMIPDTVLENAGIEFIVDEVRNVDTKKKICSTSNGSKIQYEKLVFATGSKVRIPKWLKGADKKNVYTIPKEKEYLDKMINDLSDYKKIVPLVEGSLGLKFLMN